MAPDTIALLLLIIGPLTFSGAVAALYLLQLWRRIRHLPVPPDEQLAQLVDRLRQTVETLQEDHVRDVATIKALQAERAADAKRIAVLEDRQDEGQRTIYLYRMRVRQLDAELTHYRRSLPAKVAYKPHRLEPDQLVQLRIALLDCYSQYNQWAMLLGDLGRPIDQVALGDNLEQVASAVLNSANEEGWIAEFMAVAAANRLNVCGLQELVEELTQALAI
jgi:hypothetical protein